MQDKIYTIYRCFIPHSPTETTMRMHFTFFIYGMGKDTTTLGIIKTLS
jgi:hypothetical protein